MLPQVRLCAQDKCLQNHSDSGFDFLQAVQVQRQVLPPEGELRLEARLWPKKYQFCTITNLK